jgi:uncharacterized membrane protein
MRAGRRARGGASLGGRQASAPDLTPGLSSPTAPYRNLPRRRPDGIPANQPNSPCPQPPEMQLIVDAQTLPKLVEPRSSKARQRRPGMFSPRERLILRLIYGSLIAALLYAFGRVYQMLEISRHLTGAHFRVDPRPLLESGFIIQAHVAGALSSFLLGTIIMLQPKGSRMHRQLGWAWVVTMGAAAVASIFIQGEGQFSWIHGFTAVTLIVLPIGVALARAHKARLHARFMTALFLGGMLGAGIFTFLPGRMMWELFFAV